MKCPNCENELEEQAAFCPYCGTRMERIAEIQPTQPSGSEDSMAEETKIYVSERDGQEEQPEEVIAEQPTEQKDVTADEDYVFCSACGKQINASASCCPYCGTMRNQTQDMQTQGGQMQYGFEAQPSGTYGYPQKKSGKKGGIIAAVLIAVAALIAVVAAIVFLRPQKSAFLYLKEEQKLYANSYKQNSDQRIDKERGISWQYLSEDKKHIYYSVYDNSDYQYNVYRLKTSNLKKEPQRVAKDVFGITFLKNNSFVYIDREGNLYLSDGKHENKIDRNVYQYCVAKNEKKILWIDNDRDMFVQDLKAKGIPEKIASNVTEVTTENDDFSKIIFRKNDGVYVLSGLGNEKKLIEGVDYYDWSISETGEVFAYYTKQGESRITTLYDFIDDDMFDQDQQITEPVRSQYEHTEIVKSFWGNYEDTVLDDAYYEAYDRYEEKLYRDELREQLKNYEFNLNQSEVYMYSDELGEISLGSFYSPGLIYVANRNKPLSILSYVSIDGIGKVKFSEVQSDGFWTAEERVSELLNERVNQKRYKLFYRNDNVELNLEDGKTDVTYSIFDPKNGNMYIGTKKSDGTKSDIQMVSIKDGLGMPQKYLEDVDTFEINNGRAFYTIKGDLYCDGDLIMQDAENNFSLSEIPDSEKLLLVEHQNTDSGYNVKLSILDGKQVKRIESGVQSYAVWDEAHIVYLTDYNTYSQKGTLSCYDGKKVQRLTKEVSSVLWQYYNQYSGYSNWQYDEEDIDMEESSFFDGL